MNKKYTKIDGPFRMGWGRCPDYLNKCGSCGEMQVKGDEYRRTLNEEVFNRTGGREGRIYYCVPCGERISREEVKEENREREEYNSRKNQNAQRIVKSCSTEINSLEQKLTREDVTGTVKDYKKIIIIEKRLKNLGNCEGSLKEEIENLKNSCRNLINAYISPKDRKTGSVRYAIHSPCCTPKNIKLDEENNRFYCDYCWETESPRFLKSLKSYHINKLNKLMLDSGISATELNSSNYQSMLMVPDMFLTQTGIRDTYQKVEKDLQDFLEKKDINLDKSNQIKSNQIKSNQIKSNQIKSNQIKSNQIKSNLRHFQYNLISSIELTDNGSLKVNYSSGKAASILKSSDLSSNSPFSEIKKEMEKDGVQKLTREDLEKKMKELEQKDKKEQSPKDKSYLGLKIGIGVGIVGLLLVIIATVVKKSRKK